MEGLSISSIKLGMVLLALLALCTSWAAGQGYGQNYGQGYGQGYGYSYPSQYSNSFPYPCQCYSYPCTCQYQQYYYPSCTSCQTPCYYPCNYPCYYPYSCQNWPCMDCDSYRDCGYPGCGLNPVPPRY
jgi:hypothetical protein